MIFTDLKNVLVSKWLRAANMLFYYILNIVSTMCCSATYLYPQHDDNDDDYILNIVNTLEDVIQKKVQNTLEAVAPCNIIRPADTTQIGLVFRENFYLLQ